MKRIVLIVLLIAILFSTNSSNKEKAEFTFMRSLFGDSMEQVKQAEGDDGETGEMDDYQSLQYERKIYKDYKGTLNYYFKGDELKLIDYLILYEGYNKVHIEDVYHDIKETFLKYGSPTKEEALEYTWYQALWIRDGYGIFLFVMNDAIMVICSCDPGKAERFYSSYLFTDLFSDSGISGVRKQNPGPDFYNDPYEISSFISVPKEGYEYIVRNSISEEELSILKDKPSIQQLISVFGYPPMSEIYRNPVMDNGEVKYVKEYLLSYFVGNRLIGVDYDEHCNFIKVHYDKSLTGIPETTDLTTEKPLGIVRNDITRDRLSFITSETTPEELQSVLGAPHRECYNAQLFRRTGQNFIRFFMSRHFLYPLKDGGILDVRYSKGKDGGLGVSTANIYEDNGEITVLVDNDY